MISYFCPKDSQSLYYQEGALHCEQCHQKYPINSNEIALLDIVQLPEAHAFDERHVLYETMNNAELESSKYVAERFIDCALKLNKDRKNINSVLDVACGKGELTIGLGLSQRLKEANIAAFDHSLTSLEAMVRSANKLGIRNRLNLSTQDITALAYKPLSFDFIFGNAVLHHFLDWKQFISNSYNLLKPGGTAVFSEPFAAGYIVPMIVFKMAAKLTGLTPTELASPEMGLFNFIIDNIGTRVRARSELSTLQALTDKHFFCLEEILSLGNSLGFQVETEEFEKPEYYNNMIDDFTSTYRITHPEFIKNARAVYSEIREYLADAYPTIFSHFRFIILQKS